MLDSALRVTGTQKRDWTITNESSKERYNAGLQEIQGVKRIGYVKMMYTRDFYPDGCGDFEKHKGTLSGLLGLPAENIDEATKLAMERAKQSG
ncbi:hypothetical protein GQ53DRAFT_466018 [Thozetella sp. PMI_491]|nr:hypothetical protein GQ53DRAFT_466018 [Thozetella sp. PMI_491]